MFLLVNKTSQDERLSDGTKISDLTIPEEGNISSKVWSDPELYELELRRIFAKTWNFVAHETEIPNPNDYVTRFVGNDRVIAVRTEDGRRQCIFKCLCTQRNASLPSRPWKYKNIQMYLPWMDIQNKWYCCRRSSTKRSIWRYVGSK